MLGANSDALILSGGDKRASGQVIGFPEQACRSLVDGCNRRFLEKIALYPGKLEVMRQINFHLPAVGALKVGACNDS